jgi:hydrogenase maturation protease
MVRTLIIGIGNPVLGDDAVGIHVTDALRKVELPNDVTIEEAFTGGLNLLDMVIGYDRAILVDSISLPDREVGEIIVLDPTTLRSDHSVNPHDLSFPEAVELAKTLGEEKVPRKMVLIAINIRRSLEISDRLSPEVQSSVMRAMQLVTEIVR